MITGIDSSIRNNNISFGMAVIREDSFNTKYFTQSLGLTPKKFVKNQDTLSKIAERQADNSVDIILSTTKKGRPCAKVIRYVEQDGQFKPVVVKTIKQNLFRKGSLGFLKKAERLANKLGR